MKRLICAATLLALILSTPARLPRMKQLRSKQCLWPMLRPRHRHPILPPNSGPEEIANTLAGLSDERVRTMLMEELRAKAAV